MVAEPDERNVAMLRRMAQAGADIGERIRVHDKDARYVVLDRAAFERAEARCWRRRWRGSETDRPAHSRAGRAVSRGGGR
ncbi:hypothetical protein [Janibacter melonis]|uniref:hypothetical protein n=1 Tax=Janibacter melonis TaxID=262209 RepID=UPI00209557BD|nr:hypothetical protein [Janibacter melonis]